MKLVQHLSKLSRFGELFSVIAILFIVMMLIIPTSPGFLDLLLAVNISLSVLVLLLTMSITGSLDFAVFPSLLLIMTLFRLALNVSSTRLILLDGNAGEIITAFGNFVVGGNAIVGFIIFIIIVVIQFVVITKGAERVAEVAARFTLDAMPGKQMSIDADLNAGLITDQEAKKRRKDVEREADFYGAMDGASKFVKGDAIAGIIISLINIIGGIVIGMVQKALPFNQAITRYSLLTVGDGLVSQIPALLMSTAMGILVTRAASESNLGHDLNEQLFGQSKVLYIAAGLLFFLGLVPGLPTFPFIIIGLLLIGISYLTSKTEIREIAEQAEKETAAELQKAEAPEKVIGLVQFDPIELEIGYSLIPYVDQEQGGDLLDRITLIRKQVALELGVVLPIVRIRDNLQLLPNDYLIKIKGVEVGKGELMPHHYLAMDSGDVLSTVDGIPTTEPAFGLAALWINEKDREEAEISGYTTVDPPSVLATHLTELLRSHAQEFIGRQEVKNLITTVKESAPAVIEELTPEPLSLGDIQKVLQNLVKERVSIRNLIEICEILADYAAISRDTDYLTEMVRQGLRRQISRSLVDERNRLQVITVSPEIEETILEAVKKEQETGALALPPDIWQSILNGLSKEAESVAGKGLMPIILISPQIRLAFYRLIEHAIPRITVISYNEIDPSVQVQGVGMVKFANAS
ncbi:MAG: flagellar biosynthesis protein FlhA [Firmicutes bacterium]|nr:flagellar biosynthesis protein FlhA [Bacillota bacterium]MDD4693968.1 flagellar biosynthesis protein FlhA [Bacillota bacterium]